MSDQDDTLLDEDLGDEEYDLGNDEEEALLADDYEIDRQNSYKGEEETDDVLDLGVTDALDDLDAEDDNNDHNPNNCYTNDQHHENHVNYYNQEDNINYNDENNHQHYENNIPPHGGDYGGQAGMHHVTSDLREKLKKSIPREIIVGNGQGMEDDDCDEARERRNRFQSERTMISTKMNNEIPDSLESVVTIDQPRMSFRGRGRGRGLRGARGARFGGSNMIVNFNPRFPVRLQFEDQNPQFRPPLLEARQPIFPNAPTNQMNPPIIYHQENPHIPLQFQQFPQGVSPHPRPHFNDPRPPFNPNQFRPPPSQGPRLQNPQMEFVPRGPMQPGGPRYNRPQNPQFIQNQPHFQRPPHESEIAIRPMGNRMPMMTHQGPALLNNMPRPPMPGQLIPLMHQGPQRHPGMPGIPRQEGPMQVYRQPGPNQMQQIQHNGLQGQQIFENRPPFQQQETRNIYEQRQFDNRPVPVNQFNNPGQQVIRHQTPGPPAVATVPNVPLASGHKILINPHFRGNVQSSQEARPAWEGSQPPSRQQQTPNEQFKSQSGQYHGQQTPYNQQSAPQTSQASQDYQKKYPQNNKNDDPYAYFSDVWQENKSVKPTRNSPPPSSKPYSGENNYSRDSNNYRDYEKYKSDGRDNYQDNKEQRYRDKSPQPRTRDHHPQRSRAPPTNNNYHDSYDQRSRPQNSSNRSPLKAPQKRTPEPHDRTNRGISPKRSKNNRHESRSASHYSASTKKEEDMDPEMRDYRKKMEEQKRLREKILQEKENRRKQAAMDKQIDETKSIKNLDSQQENKSLVTSIKKDSVDSQSQLTNRTRIRAESGQTTEDKEAARGRETMSTDKNSPENSTVKKSQTENISRTISSGARRVVIQKNSRVVTSLQKVISNIQKPSSNSRSVINSDDTNEKVTEITKIVKKIPLGVQKKSTNIKKIVNEQSETGRKVLINDSTSGNVKTVHSNRVVLQKPIQIKRTIDNKTNVVIVENISSSTTENKIREMSRGIGTLESVIMGEGSATVVFKTHSAAMVFHKKYQQKMIDQSVINIRLVSQAGTVTQRT